MTLLDDVLVPDDQRYSVPAPFAKRMANGIVDLLAIGLLTYLGLWLMVQMNSGLRIFGPGSFTLPLLFLVVQWLYYFSAEASSGRTLGKWLSSTVVRSTDGTKPGTAAIVLRTSLRLIPLYPLLFLIGLRWHDRLANCEVFEFHAR